MRPPPRRSGALTDTLGAGQPAICAVPEQQIGLAATAVAKGLNQPLILQSTSLRLRAEMPNLQCAGSASLARGAGRYSRTGTRRTLESETMTIERQANIYVV